MSSVWRSAGREMPRQLRSSRSRFAFDAALDLRLYFAFHVAVHRLSLPIFLPRFSSACVRSFLHPSLSSIVPSVVAVLPSASAIVLLHPRLEN